MIATGPYVGKRLPGLERWVNELMIQPHVLAGFPVEQQTAAWRELLLHKAEEGLIAVYVPVVDGRTVGLYWADLCGAGVAFGHQVLAADAKGLLAGVTAMRCCISALFRDYDGIHHLYGLTPKRLPGALAVARRAGMQVIGESYDANEDCWFLGVGRREWEARYGE